MSAADAEPANHEGPTEQAEHGEAHERNDRAAKPHPGATGRGQEPLSRHGQRHDTAEQEAQEEQQHGASGAVIGIDGVLKLGLPQVRPRLGMRHVEEADPCAVEAEPPPRKGPVAARAYFEHRAS